MVDHSGVPGFPLPHHLVNSLIDLIRTTRSETFRLSYVYIIEDDYTYIYISSSIIYIYIYQLLSYIYIYISSSISPRDIHTYIIYIPLLSPSLRCVHGLCHSGVTQAVSAVPSTGACWFWSLVPSWCCGSDMSWQLF